MKVDYKKPWKIWPFQSYGMIKKDALAVMNSGDFTMSVSFKPGELISESKVGGICLRPGAHSGFTIVSYDKYQLRFEFWYNDGENDIYVALKKFIDDASFFNEFNLLTVTFDSKNKTFKFYVNSELADSITFTGEFKDYTGLPIFFGCGAYNREEDTNFMECYYDFYLLCDSIIDLSDIIYLKDNLYKNLNQHEYIKNEFSKNIVVCYDFIKKTPHKVWDFSGNSNYLLEVDDIC